jgi:hypothetical protein
LFVTSQAAMRVRQTSGVHGSGRMPVNWNSMGSRSRLAAIAKFTPRTKASRIGLASGA